MKAYETWSHLLVQECGKAELLPYDQVESSLAFYEKGGTLYRVTCRGVYRESPMCLDFALSGHSVERGIEELDELPDDPAAERTSKERPPPARRLRENTTARFRNSG